MEPRHIHFYAIMPLAGETIDTTNKRIRRVIHFNVFYNEEEENPESITDRLIGVESTFPDEEEHVYRYDDVVFTAPHRVRMHLSRPMSV